jgi:hypothetical protein
MTGAWGWSGLLQRKSGPSWGGREGPFGSKTVQELRDFVIGCQHPGVLTKNSETGNASGVGGCELE